MGWTEARRDSWRGVYRDISGKRIVSKPFAHKAAAQVWADDQTDLVKAGISRDPRRGRITLRAFAETWQDSRSVEATTAASDAGRLKAILAEFGDRPLEHVDPLQIQGWAKRLRRSGKSAGTVAKYVHLLSGIMAAAIVDRRITDNPCKYVSLDTPAPGREVYLTHEQVDLLMSATSRDVDQLAIHLLAYTGVRWGEATGLHRSRVDFLRKRIQVADVLVEVSGDRFLKQYPKGREQRWVPIPDHLITGLAKSFEGPSVKCGLEMRDAVGNVLPHRCSGIVLSDTDPVRRRPRGFVVLSRHTWGRDVFTPALAAAKLPPETRPHDLRHSYSSWVAASGVPMRELQRRLGHKSLATTERYSHFYEAADANMAGLERPGKAISR